MLATVTRQQKKRAHLMKRRNEERWLNLSVEKYTHYYERWATNQSSRQKAMADLQQMQSVHLEKLSETQCQPESQLKFIIEAWLQIIECRRVLKWTCAYGYYLPEEEHAKRQFFEYLQGEAEFGLERLHQCAEKELQVYLNADGPLKEFNEFRSKLAGLTSVTRTFFENLVRALENGLSDVNSHGACSRMGSSKSLGGGSSRGRSGKGKASNTRSSGSNRNTDDSSHCQICCQRPTFSLPTHDLFAWVDRHQRSSSNVDVQLPWHDRPSGIAKGRGNRGFPVALSISLT